MCLRVRTDCEAGVIGHVEPLVSVACPGVGAFETGDEFPGCGVGRGPQPERAVHVDPSTMAMRHLADRVEIVERARCHVAGLGAHDRGCGRRRVAVERRGELRRVHRTVGCRADRCDRVLSDPEQMERAVDRRVPFITREHTNARGAEQAVGIVPSGCGEHVVPGRGEADRVRRLRAGDEAHRRVLRKRQQLLQPPTGNHFRRDGRR